MTPTPDPRVDEDAERLAKLRNERDAAPIEYRGGKAWPPGGHRFAWIDIDFLIQQIDSRNTALREAREENERLRAEFLECARYDATMEGPKFMAWNSSALNRLRAKYEATRSQPATPSPAQRFAEAIQHGDDEHRRWLLEAARAFDAGEPIPPPGSSATPDSAGEGGQPVPETRVLELLRQRISDGRNNPDWHEVVIRFADDDAALAFHEAITVLQDEGEVADEQTQSTLAQTSAGDVEQNAGNYPNS